MCISSLPCMKPLPPLVRSGTFNFTPVDMIMHLLVTIYIHMIATYLQYAIKQVLAHALVFVVLVIFGSNPGLTLIAI